MTIVDGKIVTSISANHYSGTNTFTLPINVVDATIFCTPPKGISSGQNSPILCSTGNCYDQYKVVQNGMTPCVMYTKKYPITETICHDTTVTNDYAPKVAYSTYYDEKKFQSTYITTAFTSGIDYLRECTTYSKTDLFDTTTYFELECQEKTTTEIPVVQSKTTTGYGSSCETKYTTTKSLEDLKWTTKVYYNLKPTETICESSLVTTLTYSIEHTPGTRTYTDCSMVPVSRYAYYNYGIITSTVTTESTSTPTLFIPTTTTTTTSITPTETPCTAPNGFPCCPEGTELIYIDDDGSW